MHTNSGTDTYSGVAIDCIDPCPRSYFMCKGIGQQYNVLFNRISFGILDKTI